MALIGCRNVGRAPMMNTTKSPSISAVHGPDEWTPWRLPPQWSCIVPSPSHSCTAPAVHGRRSRGTSSCCVDRRSRCLTVRSRPFAAGHERRCPRQRVVESRRRVARTPTRARRRTAGCTPAVRRVATAPKKPTASASRGGHRPRPSLARRPSDPQHPADWIVTEGDLGHQRRPWCRAASAVVEHPSETSPGRPPGAGGPSAGDLGCCESRPSNRRASRCAIVMPSAMHRCRRSASTW